ncbi:MAG: hypothetical protein U0835_12995 [Isosphaeraceae bacterium]
MSANEDARKELDALLAGLEAACRDQDEGRGVGPDALAGPITALLQGPAGGASLLSRLGGTYTRLASSVPKTPHAPGLFLPLVNVVQDMTGSYGLTFQASTGPTGLSVPPRCQARLGRKADFRQVQAPDWWKSEAVFLLDHSKLTRKDVAEGTRLAGLNPLRIEMTYGSSLEVPWQSLRPAALRQLAHELLSSQELSALAGRKTR